MGHIFAGIGKDYASINHAYMKPSHFELRIQRKHTKHIDRRSKTNVTFQAQVHIIYENQRIIFCSQSKR